MHTQSKKGFAVVFFIILLMQTKQAYAQWPTISFGAAANVSQMQGASSEPGIVVEGSDAYLVWTETSGNPDSSPPGTTHVNFRLARHNGSKFEPSVQISDNLAVPGSAGIAVSGDNVFVVWREYYSYNYTWVDPITGISQTGIAYSINLFAAASTDKGAHFNAPLNISNNSSGFGSYDVSFDVFGDYLYLAWGNGSVSRPYGNGVSYGTDIYFAVVDKSGILLRQSNLSASLPNGSGSLSGVAGNSRSPNVRVAGDGSTIYVSYVQSPVANLTIGTSGVVFSILEEYDHYRNSDIYFQKSTNNGVSFTVPMALTSTNHALPDFHPRMAAWGNDIYIVWTHWNYGADRDTNLPSAATVRFAASYDGGISFPNQIPLVQDLPLLGSHLLYSGPSSPRFSGQHLYILFETEQATPLYHDLWVMASDDKGLIFRSPALITEPDIFHHILGYSAFALDNNLYVAWSEQLHPSDYGIFFSNSIDVGQTFRPRARLNGSGKRAAGLLLSSSLDRTAMAMVWTEENSGSTDHQDREIFLRVSGDTDGDSLLDAWETDGIDSDGDGTIDYKLPCTEDPGRPGSNICPDPFHKDIYVEIDYMPLHKPSEPAMGDVVKAFRRAPVDNPDGTQGINLHLQIDESITIAPDDWPTVVWTAFHDVKTRLLGGQFGTVQERGKPNATNILEAKKLVFHYAEFVHSLDIGGYSGVAELGGNDLIVSLGGSGGGWGKAFFTSINNFHSIGTRDEQAGVFMHELGHNLGLHHGGGDEINCKPNYLSIMSYSRIFPSSIPDRALDFSSVCLDPLNENTLDENKGISWSGLFLPVGIRTVWGPPSILIAVVGPNIDWNANGSLETGIPQNLNNIGPNTGCNGDDNGDGQADFTLLNGFDDWGNLQYSFRASPYFATGASPDPGEIPEVTFEEVRQMRIGNIDSLDSNILQLPDAAFDDPSLSTQRKTDLHNTLQEVMTLVQSDDLPTAAIRLRTMRERMDGSSGGNPSDDWITEASAQEEVLKTLDNALAVLTKALSSVAGSIPIANAGPDQTVAEGSPVTLDGTGSADLDGDPLTYYWAQTAGPSVILEEASSPHPTFTAPPVSDTTLLTFRLIVDDGASLTTGADVVDVMVLHQNRAPGAADDFYTGSQDIPLIVSLPGVLGNDGDPEEDPITAVLTSGPAHGALTLNSDGSFIYTPNVGYSGSDFFTYQASDGTAGSNIAVVTLLVNPSPRPPDAIVQPMSGGTIGRYNDLVLDADGNRHIIYFEVAHASQLDRRNNYELKYLALPAVCNPLLTSCASSLLPETVDRGDWHPADLSYTEDYYDGAGEYGSMSVDSGGSPHVSYIAARGLSYAARINGIWQVETVDPNPGNAFYAYSSIALDRQGNPHISYIRFSHPTGVNGVMHAFKSNGIWTIERADGAFIGGAVNWTSIALDSNGNPRIAYHDDYYRALKYAERTVLGTWLVSFVDYSGRFPGYSGSFGYWPSLILDPYNNPYISYVGWYGTEGSTESYLKYATRSAGTWEIENVDVVGISCCHYPGWDISFNTSMAMDSSGQIHVGYTSAEGIKHAVRQPGRFGGWSRGIIDSDAGVISMFDSESISLVVASCGAVQMIYPKFQTVTQIGLYNEYIAYALIPCPDTIAPVVTPPNDITVSATEAYGARGNASAVLDAFLAGGSAVDDRDPSPVRLSPQVAGEDADNNTLFSIGTMSVFFRFQDASGNVGSAMAYVTVIPVAQPVQTIFDLTARAKDRKIDIVWTCVPGNVTYNIYRSTTQGGPYTQVKTGHTSTYCTYADFGLVNGTTYYYRVTSVDATGLESLYSNEASGKPVALIRLR